MSSNDSIFLCCLDAPGMALLFTSLSLVLSGQLVCPSPLGRAAAHLTPIAHPALLGFTREEASQADLSPQCTHLTPRQTALVTFCKCSVYQQSTLHYSSFLADFCVCGYSVEHSGIRSLPTGQVGMDRGYLLRCDSSSLLPSMVWLSSKGAAHFLLVVVATCLNPASLQACTISTFR